MTDPAGSEPFPTDATRLRPSGARSGDTPSPHQSGGQPEAPAGPPPAEGVPFGRYRLLDQLGAGAMGLVFRAFDVELRREVALKMIHPRALGDSGAVTRFLREGQIAARLRHPRVLAVHDAGEVDGKPYLAMELVRGRTLQHVLAERVGSKRGSAPMVVTELRSEMVLLLEIAEGVAAAHHEGILHRDLKPANVMIDGQGHARVMDFGIARDTAADSEGATRLTGSGDVVGTPAYLSPEMAQGKRELIGPMCDVWSLGVMLYEMLAGRLPFQGDDVPEVMRQVVERDPLRPRVVRPTIPLDLEAVCLRALEKDPQRRYRNAGEFASELRHWLAGEPVQARRFTPAYRMGRWARRHRGALAGVLVVALAIAADVAWIAWARANAEIVRRDRVREIAAAVGSFTDQVMRVELSADARQSLAQAPLEMLERDLRLRPDDALIRAWRGRVRQLLGDRAGARADFDAACAGTAPPALAWLMRGRFALEQYVESRGLPIFGGVVAGGGARSRRAENATERDLRRAATADLAQAQNVARERGDELDETDVRWCRARELMTCDHAEDAACAVKLLKEETVPEGLLLRGMAYVLSGQLDPALADLDRVVEAWPQSAQAWLWRGHTLVQMADRALERDGAEALELAQRARADYEQALRREPGNPVHKAGVGGACDKIASATEAAGGDGAEWRKRAVQALNEVVQQQPADGAAFYNRGNAWRREAESLWRRGLDATDALQHAETDYTEALRLAPEIEEAWLNRGDTRLLRGQAIFKRVDEALEALRAAEDDFNHGLGLSAEDPELLVMRGSVRGKIARALEVQHEDAGPTWAAAVKDLERGLELKPDHALYHANLGTVLSDWSQVQEARGQDCMEAGQRAIRELSRALELRPKAPDVLRTRGRVAALLAFRQATNGQYRRELATAALEDLDLAATRATPAGEDWQARGCAHAALALTGMCLDGNPGAHLETAISCYEQAIQRGQGLAWRLLAMLRWELRDDAGARAAITEFARAEHLPSAELDRMMSELTASLPAEQPGWRAEATRGERLLMTGDYPGARAAFEAALARFEEWRLGAPPEEAHRQARLVDGPGHLTSVHFNLACILSLLSAGRRDPVVAPQPIAAGEAQAFRDAAFDHLRTAVELGMRDVQLLRTDATLDPLRGDPRFAEIEQAMTR